MKHDAEIGDAENYDTISGDREHYNKNKVMNLRDKKPQKDGSRGLFYNFLVVVGRMICRTKLS